VVTTLTFICEVLGSNRLERYLQSDFHDFPQSFKDNSGKYLKLSLSSTYFQINFSLYILHVRALKIYFYIL
jgi:hypothetical protein